MSASNYTRCPKCKLRSEADFAKETDEAHKQYGVVTQTEYMTLLRALRGPKEINETLREDWQLGTDDGGTFRVSYRSECGECGFAHSFRHEQRLEIKGVKEPRMSKRNIDEVIELWRESFSANIRNHMPPNFPKVVTLCGSTRFGEAFREAMRSETLAGNIVLSVGLLGHAEGIDMGGPVKKMLDELHFRKIEMCDEILVLDCDQPWCPACEMHCLPPIDGRTRCCDVICQHRPYIGRSTRNEIAHARKRGKVIRYQSLESR